MKGNTHWAPGVGPLIVEHMAGAAVVPMSMTIDAVVVVAVVAVVVVVVVVVVAAAQVARVSPVLTSHLPEQQVPMLPYRYAFKDHFNFSMHDRHSLNTSWSQGDRKCIGRRILQCQEHRQYQPDTCRRH